jgi:hypothetical protein
MDDRYWVSQTYQQLIEAGAVGALPRRGHEAIQYLMTGTELAVHRLDQLPPHRRGEGFEGGGVEGMEIELVEGRGP